MENDRLIQETLRQAAEIDALNSQLTQANRKGKFMSRSRTITMLIANQSVHDLESTNQQLSSLQEHLDETQEGKKLIERQLKFGSQEIASRDAEIDKLNETVQKKDREIETISRKNDDYKK